MQQSIKIFALIIIIVFAKLNFSTAQCTPPAGVSITVSPGSTICSGQSVTFTASASNALSNSSFVWSVNGSVQFSSSTVKTFTTSTLTNGQQVSCTMYGTGCSGVTYVSSNVITMTVNSSVVPSVSISADKTGSVCQGTNVTFTANATNGGSAPAYVWTVNGTTVSSGSATYSSSSLNNNDQVRCTLTSNAACVSPTSATSNTITMSITPTVSPSVSLSLNTGTSICYGTSVTFTATPVNGGTPTYKWIVSGVEISGVTGNVFTTNTLNTGTPTVVCVMTSSIACANQASAIITMNVTPIVTPSVSIASSTGTTSCTGQSVKFTATPVNGGTSPTYKWFVDGTQVSGVAGNTYTTSSLASGTRNISCSLISNATCSSQTTATSNTIAMTVVQTVVPSVSIAPNTSTTICYGTSVTFTATPSNGGSAPTYKWYVNGALVSGVTGSTYTTSSLASGTRNVSCILTSNATCVSPATANSNTVIMNVVALVSPSATIAVSPGTTIYAGTTVTFTATPTNGGSAPQYKWYVSGSLVSGANGNTFSTSSLVSGMENISCILTSNASCLSANNVSSNVIAMTINSIPLCKSTEVQLGNAFTTSKNYIAIYNVRQPGITDPADPANTTCQVIPTIKYFDDLGRLIQTVNVKSSPSLRDVVLLVQYNSFGLEEKKYLPYVATTATSDGTFKSNGLSDQISFYANPANWNAPAVAATTTPFAGTSFEQSTLNRIVEQGAAGEAWQLSTSQVSDKGHTMKIQYTFNNNVTFNSSLQTNNPGSRRVALYTATINSDRSRTLARLNNTATYNDKELQVTITKNENWTATDGCIGTNEEYKDREGHVILRRTYNKNGSSVEMLSTYYVYDALSNLCFVLPPSANADADVAITQTVLDNLCYQYRYDTRNRMTDKKVPGKGWEYLIYNNLDQIVMTQDAIQRSKTPQEWTITKYDALGRVIITGKYLNSGSVDVQAQVNAQTTQWESTTTTGNGYTANTFPTTWTTTYTINYYDNYSYPGAATYPYASGSKMTKGLLTGNSTNILGTTSMLLSQVYYDDKGRVVKSFSQHYKNGAVSAGNYEETTNTYDFTNAPLTSLKIIKVGGTEQTRIFMEYEYDHTGRRKRSWERINFGTKVLMAQLEYNELGQLVDKKLHSTDNAVTFKQSVDFRYNTRGWLTSINNAQLANDAPTNNDTNDYFGMELAYNTDLGTGNSACYNGNIGGMKWSSDLGYGTVKQRAYNFKYDALNRIISAAFKEKSASWSDATNAGFSESGYTYDLNGNIKSLTRYDKRGSAAPMDILTYTYAASSNQLLKVADTGDKFTGFSDGTNTGNDFTYDNNGNMITDQNKGITSAITYNYLNLPEIINRGGNKITYYYDASGRKLSQLVTFGSLQKRTDYIGELVYENNVLQFITHEEGRVVMADTKLIYIDGCDATTTMTALNTTLTPVTQNGTEKYVKIQSNGTTTKTGVMFSTGNSIQAVAGERYRIRAKGYRDKGTAASSSAAYILIQVNGSDVGWPGAALPAIGATASTESWVEQIVTIATSGTLQAGIAWNTVASGELIYLNDFEITKLSDSATPEFQYDIKDHLGNVRLTFTTKDLSEPPSLATMEPANRNAEGGKFVRYDRVRVVNNQALFDHTNDPSTSNIGSSIRLSGNDNEKTGLVKTLAVMPGDVVQMEVYAKYLDTDKTSWTQTLTDLVTAISTGTTGVVSDGAQYPTNPSNPFPYTGLNGTALSTGTGPKAYLNYIMFDKDFNPILPAVDPSQTFYVRMTTAGKENGKTNLPNGVAHELLTATVTVKQAGYLYIYLSNEEASPVEVYFDDFKVTHTKTSVIQMDDYYPFGLTFNSSHRENTLTNDFLYNGKKRQDELNLGWFDYGARMYEPSIGRWMVVDPLAEVNRKWSPYNYAYDNPIRFIDPDGMYSTEEWKKDNGVEDSDVITVYKAESEPDQTDPKSDNDKMNENEGFVSRTPVFYKPWILQSEYTKKSAVRHTTFDASKTTKTSTEFNKDKWGTRLLQADLGLLAARGTGVLLAFFEGAGWVTAAGTDALSLGIGIGAGWSVDGLELQISYETTYAEGENWYGKVQYNALSGEIEAVDYYGSEQTKVAVSLKRIERIFDTNTNTVLATRVNEAPISNTSATPLPKNDCGNIIE